VAVKISTLLRSEKRMFEIIAGSLILIVAILPFVYRGLYQTCNTCGIFNEGCICEGI